MKRSTALLSFLIIFMFSIQNINAQLFDKIKEAVKEETKDETTKTAENEVKKETWEDQGKSDGIHGKYIKKVVFSKKTIEEGNGKEENLSDIFTLGTDDIYFRAYYDGSIYNQCQKAGINYVKTNDWLPGKLMVYFIVNGVEVGKTEKQAYWITPNGPEADYKTTFGFTDAALTKFPKKFEGNPSRSFIPYVIPKLVPGDNLIKVIVAFSTTDPDTKKEYIPAEPLAQGEFKITLKNPADIKTALIKSGMIKKAEQENPKLEKEIKELCQSLPNNPRTPAKVIITSKTWDIKQDGLIIIERYLFTSIIFPTSDGKYEKCDYIARQNHMGGGKYGKTFLEEVAEDCLDVPAIFVK